MIISISIRQKPQLASGNPPKVKMKSFSKKFQLKLTKN